MFSVNNFSELMDKILHGPHIADTWTPPPPPPPPLKSVVSDGLRIKGLAHTLKKYASNSKPYATDKRLFITYLRMRIILTFSNM